ncbi:uncharacterized protein LOC134261608 isoform X2 [Saccostrea cucullata]|uniref:uncharacterized protein LOC134261608 isoform X2 n=1 Tax=Saccostrea cuccullata TaxID=36930 RepID=UPI002ED19C53
MSETPVPRADSRGRRCVAGGCSNTKMEGISLHYFPFDRPAVLRRWIQFVQQYRRDWKGPSKTSTLCSVHFTEDAYPAKYKIMESVGVTVPRKDLNKDAIPTLQTKVGPSTTPALALGKRKAHPTTPLTSTPKKPRRAYLRRESKRIVLEFEQARRESKSDTLTEAGRDGCNPQGVEGTQTEQQRSDDIPKQPGSDNTPEQQRSDDIPKQPGSDNTPEQQRSINTPTIELDEERCTNVVEMVAKETRTVGCQRSLTKPMRKSHYTQTKWKTSDKVVQAGNPVKTRDVGIACELLPAPPLRRLGEPETPVLREECADTTFSSIGTDDGSDEEDESVHDDSFSSIDSEDLLEADRGDRRGMKFIVYHSQLMDLFATCPRCASPSLADIVHSKGTFISVRQECGCCRFSRIWSSQPLIGAIPAGNFELSCAILFSGSLPTKSIRMLQFMDIATISVRTFMNHQQHYLHPTILSVWKNHQNQYVQQIQDSGQPVRLGGDGRADTPGHCAKFGSYTAMDLDKNIVIDVQLVQSNEVGGSCRMEKEGLIRVVQFLQQNNIEVCQLITDRHLQVAKWVRENMPDTTHYVDVWHVAKGLKKKLTALGKEKDCERLMEWIKSIVNHLYWVPTSTPEGSNELRWEKWVSVFNHIQNIHEGHGDLFERCEHAELDEAARRKRWLRPGTKVVEKLEAIITSRQMKKDIPMLSPDVQTSSLEAYHSVINHYAPKMNKFSYHGMQSRLLIAAMHFNENGQNLQATTKDGKPRYSITFPKQKKGDYTVKKIKTNNTYGYVESLMVEATSRVRDTPMPRCEPDEMPDDPPPLCADFLHPEKDEAIDHHVTRFRRN